jgi:hypothetical protein
MSILEFERCFDLLASGVLPTDLSCLRLRGTSSLELSRGPPSFGSRCQIDATVLFKANSTLSQAQTGLGTHQQLRIVSHRCYYNMI